MVREHQRLMIGKMKQYFLIPILLISIALSAQRYDPYFTVGQEKYFNRICPKTQYSYYHVQMISTNDKCDWLNQYFSQEFDKRPNDLENFADFFFLSLNEFYEEKYNYRPKEMHDGINFSPIETSFNVEGNAKKIKFIFKSFEGRTIAIAKSPGDRNYEIVVDPDRWNKAHIAEKLWIMWHELAHEFFSTRHGQGGGMMFPISPGDDIDIERLWNGWESMATWLVENKRKEILRLYIPYKDSPQAKKQKKFMESIKN